MGLLYLYIYIYIYIYKTVGKKNMNYDIIEVITVLAYYGKFHISYHYVQIMNCFIQGDQKAWAIGDSTVIVRCTETF
jgi:hypothetical protein